MALPDGPKNPYGNGFIPVETDLTTEKTAQRVCDPHKSRLWKIKNPNSLHPITGATPCQSRASSARELCSAPNLLVLLFISQEALPVFSGLVEP